MGFSDTILRMFAPVAEVLSFLPRESSVRSTIDPHPPAPSTRKHWLERLHRWYREPRQRVLDAYLADSKNIAELEARVRDIGPRFPSRYY